MNNLERLKVVMQTETTIEGIARKANVPIPMVQFHLKQQSNGKRLIVVKS